MMLFGSLGGVPGLICRMWVWTSRAVAAPRRKARIGIDGLGIFGWFLLLYGVDEMDCFAKEGALAIGRGDGQVEVFPRRRKQACSQRLHARGLHLYLPVTMNCEYILERPCLQCTLLLVCEI